MKSSLFTRELLQNLDTASSIEWLVSNGLGGFACGTSILGLNTRRYHGLLIGALQPPDERRLTVSSIDPVAIYGGKRYELATHEYSGGFIQAHGYRLLESFQIENGIPTWVYRFSDAKLSIQIYMAHGANVSCVRYSLLEGAQDFKLHLRPLCTFRDYHSEGHEEKDVHSSFSNRRLELTFERDQYSLRSSSGRFIEDGNWYWDFYHRKEAFRGQDCLEHLYSPGYFELELTEKSSHFISIELGEPLFPEAVFEDRVNRYRALKESVPEIHPEWVKELVVSADCFLAERTLPNGKKGTTVLAGYPWFLDWGRDTMIALPGLTVSLGKQEQAKDLLRTFGQFLDRGLLPNRFPDGSKPPEYNSVDASLWFIWSSYQVLESSWDQGFAEDLYPVLKSIHQFYSEGTLFGIGVDPADGLVRAGEPGQQLTWMDARVEKVEVTPRHGKPVEINALWYCGLRILEELSGKLGHNSDQALFAEQADHVKGSFQAFLNHEKQALFDVIHGPEGRTQQDGLNYDDSIRPNQIFAVSLPYSPLTSEWKKKVVKVCQDELLTPRGLRSLSPAHPDYQGQYEGSPAQRDAAYHQGTVWSWLLGPFAEAHFAAFGEADRALSFLEPMAHHLQEGCLTNIAENFAGDPGHESRGCFAQAWGVAETLRVWFKLWDLKER